jgi:hypothetical protein
MSSAVWFAWEVLLYSGIGEGLIVHEIFHCMKFVNFLQVGMDLSELSVENSEPFSYFYTSHIHKI